MPPSPFAGDSSAGAAAERDRTIQRMLHAARTRLGLDVAFVSRFEDGARVFKYVDAEPDVRVIAVGGSDPLEETYCRYIVDGSLPEFLPDARLHPVSAALAATAEVGVGTHLGVPIRFSDERVYGTLCCFGIGRDAGLQPQHVEVLRMLAELAADHLEPIELEERRRDERLRAVTAMLDERHRHHVVFQPLWELATGRLIAVEALSRFSCSGSEPQQMFADAAELGVGLELEMMAVEAALAALTVLPADVRLGVNVSPATLVSTEFGEALRRIPPGRVVVEITEHAAVTDYDAYRAARQRVAARGVRLSIDDVGMGFSGINHILESAPDSIKIDAAVVREVDANPAKAAMIEALVSFGKRTGVLVIAEGIESAEELATLRSLGVAVGQGYFLGRPADLTSVLAGLGRATAEVSTPTE